MQTKIISELFRTTSIVQTAACRIARPSSAGFTATPIHQRKQQLHERTQIQCQFISRHFEEQEEFLNWLKANFRIQENYGNTPVECNKYSKTADGLLKLLVKSKLTEQERGEKLEPLLKSGWSMVNGRDAIYKEYLFGDFNQAFSFMAGVALLAEKLNHHPEWFNVYNKVQVTMSTHDVGGLSLKDIRMATFMEEQSKRF